METLTLDPLSEIGRKFKNPLDIVAFELSSKNAKRAVEKYDLYRIWEKRLMPNDDARIIAAFIFDKRNFPINNREFGAMGLFNIFIVYQNRQVLFLNPRNMRIRVKKTFLPILIKKKISFQI